MSSNGVASRNGASIRLQVVARNYCANHPREAYTPEDWEKNIRDTSFCPESIVGIHDHVDDRFCQAWDFIQANNILNSAQNGVKEATQAGTTRNLAANTATSNLVVVAGTNNAGSTASAFADWALNDDMLGGLGHTDYKTLSSYCQTTAGSPGPVTVAAPSSNTRAITATINNTSGSTISYNEVGIALTMNDSGSTARQFLLSHDSPLTGGPYNVSTAGSLAVTATETWT